MPKNIPVIETKRLAHSRRRAKQTLDARVGRLGSHLVGVAFGDAILFCFDQSIDDPPTIRSEVLNIPGQLKKILFSAPIKGKLLLDAEFGVFTSIDERDTLAVFGSDPMKVERCVLLVEECIKNPTFCLEWYKNSKRT